jgi:capsular polysaccharide biosynthesis protein
VVNQLNQIATRDDPELTALNKAGLQLSAKRDKLVAQLNSANASNQSATSVAVQSLLAQLSAVEQQLSSNQSTVQQIIASLSASTGAAVVSVPVAATGVSRHTAADGALAALLGLVIGLLIATTREIIRPTIAQPGAVAAELGTVLLGNAETTGDDVITLADDLALRLDVTARRHGAHTVVLAGPVHPDRLAAIAERLNGVLPDGPPDAAVSSLWMRAPMSSLADHHASRGSQGRPLTVVALPGIRLAAPPEEPVLVVVAPPYARRAGIDRAADLAATTDWPVLGVIGLLKRRRPGQDPAEPAEPDAAEPGQTVAGASANGDTTRMGAVR